MCRSVRHLLLCVLQFTSWDHHNSPPSQNSNQTPQPVPEVTITPHTSTQTFAGSYQPLTSTHDIPATHNLPDSYCREAPLPAIPDEEEPASESTMSAVTELYPAHVTPRARPRYDTVPQENTTAPAINRTSKPYVGGSNTPPQRTTENGTHYTHNTSRSSVSMPTPKPTVDYSRKPTVHPPASHPASPTSSDSVTSSPTSYEKPTGRRYERSTYPNNSTKQTSPPGPHRPPPTPPATRPDVLNVNSSATTPGCKIDYYGTQSHYEEIPHQPMADSSIRSRYAEVSHSRASEVDTPSSSVSEDVESRRFRQMQPIPQQYYMSHQSGGRPTDTRGSDSLRGIDPNLVKDRSSSGRSFASLSSTDSHDDKQMPIKIPGRRHLSSDTPTSDPPTPVAPMSLREASRIMPQGLVNPSYRVATMAVDVMPSGAGRPFPHGVGRPVPSRRVGGLPTHVRSGIVQGVCFN